MTAVPDPGTVSTLPDKRLAGILLHPTSLPGPRAHGDLGSQAFRFVDVLAQSGVGVWQVLPLGPPQAGLSPYQCESAHAGNVALISLERLSADGLLPGPDAKSAPGRGWFELRLSRVKAGAAPFHQQAFDAFRQGNGWWLEDFALFRAIKTMHGDTPWWKWPGGLRDRDPDTLQAMRTRLEAPFEQCCFEQYLFECQWHALRAYANRRGVLLFGDMPLFVSADSADVWAARNCFRIDRYGRPEVVAGVPPDAFSDTGQRWGNPHYAWERLQEDGFLWWQQRLRSELKRVDLLRVDHFRGFESAWEIPADSVDARQGKWVPVPGQALFQALLRVFPTLPLVAEDLGYITPAVNKLRDSFGIPGMKVLQFAFDGGADNPHLPHNHVENAVVYTGTHDNDTTLGWYQGLTPGLQRTVCDYLGSSGDEMPWALIRAAFDSVARLAVIPMQDVLAMDSRHRMNTPGVASGNWGWRFSWDQLDDSVLSTLRRSLQGSDRVAG